MDMPAVVPEQWAPTAGLGPMLATARMRAGLRGREAARLIGILHVHLVQLETGTHRPSAALAALLAETLRLDAAEQAQLFRAAAAAPVRQLQEIVEAA